ncbi:MAG TPA: protein kinase [Polyangiales bacterium]|nr:protein kinase [Polyangiales bacterium]
MTSPAAADRLADRYEIHELLGRGGMASVYRATDRALGRQVALKQLTMDPTAPERSSAAALFEREFHTLAQLRHPHVIAVYDYGVGTDDSPFYTMELLDGGDLRERAPLGWRDACRLVFDVCSALALLHSRRLLHRDISPRNIRCTQDGQAKLIDFGAMAAMSGGGAEVVGTPAFTAPETLQRLALDARTDLYSLGVALYYALTARLPYPARSFSDLLSAWGHKPVPPSTLVADIPPALDDLVLALCSVEPSLRPQTAFDVMQLLAACAGLHGLESEAVSRAYLSTPTLVGREDVMTSLQHQMRDSRLQRVRGVMLEGPPGAGRSRLLDACALEAQTRGFTLLRATATGSREPFSIAHSLANHLLDALPVGDACRDFPDLFASPPAANDNTDEARPELRNFSDPAFEAATLQRTLRRWLLRVCRTHPLLIAVDDVHKMDQPSAALLAELIDKTKRGGILVALTVDSDDAGSDAVRALARRCTAMPLAPLTREQTRELFESLFGDVANLSMLADEIQRVALGNPRQTLETAQHLVDRGLIRYAAGHWTLPNRLAAGDLPHSAAAAMHARIERLSPHARFLGAAQALAYYETLADPDYRALLPDASSQEIELAISELLAAQALVRDGSVYRLVNRLWIAAFTDQLDAEQTGHCHRALATMYGPAANVPYIHHAFFGGLDRQALEVLDRRNELEGRPIDTNQLGELNVAKMQWCYPRAIETARALGRSPREVYDLRRWQYLGNILTEGAPDFESSRVYFEQLAHDSGLALYRSDTQSANPTERLTRALQTAHERYLATPEHERVYPVDEAIRKLGEYVVVSIALGSRTLKRDLVESLPGIVEPFVALAPMLDVIWNNARATSHSHCDCRYELCRELWRKALTALDAMANTEEQFAKPMGNAIAYALGMMEAQLGLASAADWAGRLDDDPYQRVSALNLRKIVRLEQGDSEGADRLRRQAEVLALQMRIPQMFKSLLTVELAAYAKSRDLAGVAQVIEQLKPIAAQHPAWEPAVIGAEGYFQLVRGDFAAAKAKFEQCIELSRLDGPSPAPNMGFWLDAQAGLTECLLGLGRDEEARKLASEMLRFCEAHDIKAPAFDLIRPLALAEARLGDTRAAVERMDALIAQQNQLGSTGLRMGLTYETRARIAIWTKDMEAFERFAELTAREYRHGARTPLGARYERLMNEATRNGMRSKVSISDFEVLAGADSDSLGSDELMTVITRSMAGSRSSDERTQLALQMICASHAARAGHLYLISPAGLLLRASHGQKEPAPELAAHVSDYVTEKQQRAIDMDDMVTGDLPQDDALTSLIQASGTSYELLPLGCVTDATSTLAGIAVVEVNNARIRNERQAQLLNAIATSLLQSGDSQGLRLTAAD